MILGLLGGVGNASPESVTGSVKVVNHGTIEVTFKVGMAIALSAGNDSVVNDGKMIGDVSLGAGNDTMDTRGGSVSGQASGGLRKRNGCGDVIEKVEAIEAIGVQPERIVLSQPQPLGEHVDAREQVVVEWCAIGTVHPHNDCDVGRERRIEA